MNRDAVTMASVDLNSGIPQIEANTDKREISILMK